MPDTHFLKTGRPARRLAWLCLPVWLFLSGDLIAGSWWGRDDEPQPQVQVAVPFVEWHSGPGAGYPVVRVSERGEWLTLLTRKTSWLKVQDPAGREGWVKVADIALTRDGAGQPVRLTDPGFEDYARRDWEAGLMIGTFGGAAVNAAYGGYWMTRNLAAELWVAQVLGDASEIRLINADIVHQPFPDWRISPFFTLGVGQVFIHPKATLSQPENRSNTAAHAGFGLRLYLTDRYFVRAEVKDYKVFTNRKTNEEATEWKLGLSVFF
ncbi:MAG: hypothetical protein R3303_03125 [Marinobacter sp.]|nr:hypothetical protein [Marinobacter sp.]